MPFGMNESIPASAQAAPEQRELDYTDAVVSALISAATGNVNALPEATGALEIAAGFYGRAFASATITPEVPAVRAFTPTVMEAIGRDMVRRGESVWVFNVQYGRASVVPCSTWDIQGKTANPNEWLYRVDIPTPSGNMTRQVSGASVLHFMYACEQSRPWKGLGPIQYASLTGQLAAMIETKLNHELDTPVANLIPTPQDGNKQTKLVQDIEQAKGDALLVKTTQGGWDEGTQARPQSDWVARRLGANPPAPLVTLRGDVGQVVLAACGVPNELVSKSEGAGKREAWRQFLHGTVQPVAFLVGDEMRMKLENAALAMSFDSLFASDLSGRARAFQSLVNGGMDVQQAAALAGLLQQDE